MNNFIIANPSGYLVLSVADSGAESGPGVWATNQSWTGNPPWYGTTAPQSATAVRVAWEQAYTTIGADSVYVVERSTAPDSGFAEVGRIAPADTAATGPYRLQSVVYEDAGVSPGTSYYYRVWPDRVRGVAQGPTAAPWGLTGTVTQYDRTTLDWAAQPGATLYAVQRWDGAAYVTRGTTTSTTYDDGGNTAVVDVFGQVGYRVVATGGSGGTSPDLVVTLPSPTLSAVTPAAGPWTPDGLHVMPMSASVVKLNCMPVPGTTPTYTFRRSPAGAGGWTTVYSGTVHQCTDTGLTASTAYDYQVRAGYGGQVSHWSDTVTASTHTASASRRLLQPGDFTPLGSFVLPFADPAGRQISYTVGGIALREGGASPKLFGLYSATSGHPAPHRMFEFAPPADAALKTAPPFAEATWVRYWGDIYGGRTMAHYGTPYQLRAAEFLAGNYESHGLAFDPDTNEVWWSVGVYYNVNNDPNPTVGRATLDLSGNTIVGTAGPWQLDRSVRGTPNESKVKGKCLRIPQWFADAHLAAGGLPWRAVGFGGSFSGAAAASFGPAAFAVAESQFSTPNECQLGQTSVTCPKVPSTCVMGFPYNAGTPYGTRPPGALLTPYDVARGGQNPTAPGYGYWSTLDSIWGGVCWIDDDAGTRTRHGLVLSGTFGLGALNYKSINVFIGAASGGTDNDGGVMEAFAVIDPADLAAVVGGAGVHTPRTRPVPWWGMDAYHSDLRTVPYVGDFAALQVYNVPLGMAFDPAASRLYVSRQLGADSNTIIIDMYGVD